MKKLLFALLFLPTIALCQLPILNGFNKKKNQREANERAEIARKSDSIRNAEDKASTDYVVALGKRTDSNERANSKAAIDKGIVEQNQRDSLLRERKKKTDEVSNQILEGLKAERQKQDSLKNIKDSLYKISLMQSTLKWRQDLEKSFGKENAAIILRHEVKIGFTEEMCEYALGSGADITETTTASTRVTHWFYPKRNAILHFKNGKLYAFTQ